jgi:GT2 family glycosyltransferase
MLEELCGFDESFFLYGDDAELGLRARLAGWRCALAPRAVAHHRYSASAGAYSSLKAFHVERNRVWLLLKLLPWSWIAASPAHTALRLALQAWGGVTGRGAAGRLAAERSLLHLVAVTLRAWASAAAGAPRMLAARRKVVRRLDPQQLDTLLSEYQLGAREIALKD